MKIEEYRQDVFDILENVVKAAREQNPDGSFRHESLDTLIVFGLDEDPAEEIAEIIFTDTIEKLKDFLDLL